MKEARLSIRVPAELVRRLDALQARVARLPECAHLGTIDRSKVARVALLRGVAALEGETAPGAKGQT